MPFLSILSNNDELLFVMIAALQHVPPVMHTHSQSLTLAVEIYAKMINFFYY